MILFTPWRWFRAYRDRTITNRYLLEVADNSEQAFKRGLRGRHSGRVYRKKGGGSHRASAPGEYPANDSGALEASIDTRVTNQEMTIGTGVFYARFLRNGTSKMARRRMSDDALKDGIAQTGSGGLRGWARWSRQ